VKTLEQIVRFGEIREDVETLSRMLHNPVMQLDGVDVFVRVVEAGGFSAAARLLGMPATTVSAKIARLEERLGTTLIQRSTRRMHVTAAGDAYYRHCREAMAALAAGEDELAAAATEPSGTIRVTMPADVTQTLLPPIVEAYLERYPRASVELIVTNERLDLVKDGVDLAMRAAPQMQDSTLTARKFGSARLALFAAPSYLAAHGVPATPADLERHSVLLHRRYPSPLELVSPGGDRFTVRQTSRIAADDLNTIRAFVDRGAGIGLLPTYPGAGIEEVLTPVLPAYGTPEANLHFVFPPGRFTPVNVRAFIDVAMDVQAQYLAANRVAKG
jgi:DNA-binding transcriptional LysR family regulator